MATLRQKYASRKTRKRKAAKLPSEMCENLTLRQHRFVYHYMKNDGNATEAAISAGYSGNRASAEVTGCRLLRLSKIASAIASLQKKVSDRTEIDIARVALELYRIMTADVGEAYNGDGTLRPLSEWPEDLRRALSGVDVSEIWGPGGDGGKAQVGELKKVRFWSKTEAANLLLKKLGGYAAEKVDHTHSFASVIAGMRRETEGQ